ncbi:hypothetical protein KEF29_12335 [Streptomyces tuirus]|uniref:Uncharacterized protein n=1 Tax=Streptomyces tuirus TaxID=68278 RepID=A0A941IZN3_9ACTN|nr:hypothetical protein [Streptomyces tuirus]
MDERSLKHRRRGGAGTRPGLLGEVRGPAATAACPVRSARITAPTGGAAYRVPPPGAPDGHCPLAEVLPSDHTELGAPDAGGSPQVPDTPSDHTVTAGPAGTPS